MSNRDFDFDLSEFDAYKIMLKSSKKVIVKVVVGSVNNLAWSQRQRYIDSIDDRMTVRDPKFVARQMRVTSARGGDINNIEALAGSVNSARSTGWGEQERGDVSNNHRTFTSFGRVGADDSRKAKGKARAKATNNFAKIGDYTLRASSKKHRLIIFLQKMTKEKRTFVMPRKYKGLKRGVYLATAGKIRRVQTFGVRKTKINKWMEPANKQIKQKEITKNWKKSLDYWFPKLK